MVTCGDDVGSVPLVNATGVPTGYVVVLNVTFMFAEPPLTGTGTKVLALLTIASRTRFANACVNTSVVAICYSYAGSMPVTGFNPAVEDNVAVHAVVVSSSVVIVIVLALMSTLLRRYLRAERTVRSLAVEPVP